MDKQEASLKRLWAELERVPDHRKARGKRHPLPAVLALAVAAMACGARSLYAIWQWGRGLTREQVAALGFRQERTPSGSTLHAILCGLDVAAFEAAITNWAASQGSEMKVLSLDGKGMRGLQGHEVAGVRLVSTTG